MTRDFPPDWPFTEPISPDWTLQELLSWLAAEDRWDDALLATVSGIEAAANRASGTPPWRGAPSLVALVRSLAVLQLRAPELRACRLGALIPTTRMALRHEKHPR